MSFAELYKDHAYADLIKEAETQGMGRGVIAERGRIVNLIRDRISRAKEYAKTGQLTAMQRPVSFEDLEAISEAIIYGIEKEANEF